MSYYDVEAIVEGALTSMDSFDEEATKDEWVATEKRMAEKDGLHTEVYVTFHDHEELKSGEECSCAQYVTDGAPTHEWNAPKEA